jgi:glycosyltransferase involved in cell wall biosynthesis
MSEQPCVSVVMPLYNEEATLDQILTRVLRQPVVRELIVVDDASRDGSAAVVERRAAADPRIRLFRHTKNQGKGAALRTGIKEATSDYVLIQDSDLEYDPESYPALMEPLLQGRADVVVGSRFIGSEAHRVLYFWHYVANTGLTLLSNMLSNVNLTDMETCYKVFRREVVQSIEIEEDRFGFEPEIIAKVAAQRVRIYEVAVSYDGRTYAEGKKIGWPDGFRALWCILKYNLLR